MFHLDRCLLEGAIQFCKAKLAVAFSFTLHIYAWYGRFFFPHENESTKAAKRKGSWAHQQTDKISAWTILSLSVVDVGDSKLWTIGCFKLSNKVLVSHISRGRWWERVTDWKVVKILGSFLWEVWVDTLGPRCSHHWGKKTNRKQTN